MTAHDLFTIRRLSALRDTLKAIAGDADLAEAVREAAWETWQILAEQLESLEAEMESVL